MKKERLRENKTSEETQGREKTIVGCGKGGEEERGSGGKDGGREGWLWAGLPSVTQTASCLVCGGGVMEEQHHTSAASATSALPAVAARVCVCACVFNLGERRMVPNF